MQDEWFVYVMGCSFWFGGVGELRNTEFYKIGISKQPHKRVSELQTGNPAKIDLLAVIRCKDKQEALRREALIHERIHYKRAYGEWINVRNKDVQLERMMDAVCCSIGSDYYHTPDGDGWRQVFTRRFLRVLKGGKDSIRNEMNWQRDKFLSA